jgi:trigger factor
MFEVKVEDVKPSRKKLHIEVPFEEIKKKKDELIERLRKTVNIKGFRKGKVPKDIILKTYKKDIEEDTKRDVMGEAYEFAISEYKIEPVSEPVFTSVVFEEDKPLSFDAAVDVKPVVDIKEYKGIEIEARKVEVADEDIDSTIKQLQDAFASLEDIEKTAEEGDVAVIEIKTFSKETNDPIKDFAGDNLYVELGKKQMIEDIENEVYGMKVGETKKVEASFDKEYPLRALKGKDVIFEITLKSLKTKKLPEINDEFAQKINKEFKTLEDLKNDIIERLKENKEKEEKDRQKEQILNKLLAEHDFELPDSLVNQETNQLMVEYVQNMYYKGADINSDEFKPQALRPKFEGEAKKRVKATFLLLAVAEKENLDVSGEEISNVISQEAHAKNKTFEELYKEYQEKNMIPIIQMDILGDKALDLLHENAKIVEVNEETPKKEETKEQSEEN